MPEPPPPPCGPGRLDDGELDRRLGVLEGRVDGARSVGEGRAREEADALASVELDLLDLGGRLARVDPDLADDRGNPVLAEAARWRRRLRALGVGDAAAAAGGLVERLVADEAARWRAGARDALASEDADRLHDALAEATVLDGEALARRGDEPGVPPLAEDRGPLRDALLDALAAAPPTSAQRDRWATEQLDRADVVLTGIDDLAPEAAAAQLDVVADDLAWHLEHVETPRGSRRVRLRRKLRRLRAEIQERGLQQRLEARFGARFVGRSERLVIALIFLVLALLAAEFLLQLSPTTLIVFTILDTLACFVFLADFFVRLAYVQGRWRWFLRHALVDLLPSIPFGLLTLHTHGADPIRAGRAIRLLRLTRVARYVRILMPVIRIVRALGFLTRGTDRLFRRYGHLLNRDIILYPTREEKRRSRAAGNRRVARLRRLQTEVADLWEDLLLSTPEAEREDVASVRVRELEAARNNGAGACPRGTRVPPAAARELTAEALLVRLETSTPEGIEAELGTDFVSRIARGVRIFSRPPLRWIPFLGSWAPRLGPGMTNAEVTAAGASHAARRLRRQHERWFFFADLYGTVTPAEFVDRVGTAMVRSAFRPAYRLALFGGIFLLVQLMLLISPVDFFHWLARSVLGPLVGNTLVLLGSICFLILGVGWWLKRLASRATTFYEQTALAQFLPLTESIKGRFLERDARILVDRVIEPEALLPEEGVDPDLPDLERRFVEGVKAWLLHAHAGGDARGAFDAMERVVLLHRDGMDGGLFHDSDTRTTNQLLGNPALRQLRRSSWALPRTERRNLLTLDLVHQQKFLSGPFFWFTLVTRAIAQSVARLIVDYNRHAIPLEEVRLAGPVERERFDRWLDPRDGETDDEAARLEKAPADVRHYVTTAFTALHFLDDDARRDQEVATRFGLGVLTRLREDRRRLFRRIFGTYPLHTRPHEQRVVNLYRLYERYLSGGRALLLPLRGLWSVFRWIGRVTGWVVDAVHEVRHPPTLDQYEQEAEADFATAVRKIDRMRGPLVQACISLRARFDVEYLGIRLPGRRRTGIEGVGVVSDLAVANRPVDFRREIEERHDSAQADVRRFSRLSDGGLFDRIAVELGVERAELGREHLRAAVFAYRADLEGVRSLLSADDVLDEVSEAAPNRTMLPFGGLFALRLRRAWKAWWKANGTGDKGARRAAWRAVWHDVDGARRALQVRARYTPDEARARGEKRLLELLRHPGRLTEQLVTLRAVSAMALIDVLNYREHVWRLGGYEADGDETAGALELDGERLRAAV